MSESSWSIFDFSGGMNMSRDPSRIGENEYYCLINGRNRYSVLQTIKQPKSYDDLIPSGKKQGCYGADNLMLVFVDGQGYIKDYSTNGNFFPIVDCLMDRNVDYIYVELVPGSVKNYKRLLNEDGTTSGSIYLRDRVSQTPRCAVVQDGINRPKIIYPNGTCRTAKDFNDWLNVYDPDKDEREYVPIGKQMLFFDGILYIVSPDGKEIYHSVSGRPLDFVIAIDQEGNKLTDGLYPEASRTSHSISYDPITCIKALNTSNGGFLVTTARASFIVTPDYTSLVYGEPTFSNTTLFPVGALNNFSVVDILGDTAIISPHGIHSFNAVLQTSNEGKNAPFSAKIYSLFKEVTQTYTAAIGYDNYSFFALDTVYGPAVAIYDTLTQVWVGIDIFSVSGYIKMFSELVVGGVRRLFFITSDNHLYEYLAGEGCASLSLYTREWSAVNDAEVEQKVVRMRAILQNIVEPGSAYMQEYVDRKAGSLKSRAVLANTEPFSPPVTFPFGSITRDTTYPVTFVPDYSLRGHKVGVYLSLNFTCDITAIQTIVDVTTTKASIEHQKTQYGT